jgi:hypothetical protein
MSIARGKGMKDKDEVKRINNSEIPDCTPDVDYLLRIMKDFAEVFNPETTIHDPKRPVMGINLIGLEPKGDRGNCFSNYIWAWHTLWAIICNTCGDILTPKQSKLGRSGYGTIIEARQAELVAEKIQTHLDSGALSDGRLFDKAKWEKGRRLYEFILKDFGCNVMEASVVDLEQNIREFIIFARASGGFIIL